MSQTPPGTLPTSDERLAVIYGSTKVKPGIALHEEVTAELPNVAHKPSSTSQKHMLIILDLSISNAIIDSSLLRPGIQIPLRLGIVPGRTTYLHYWATDITFFHDGKNTIDNSYAIAEYRGPKPPAGDVAHTYVAYLFEQSDSFLPPPDGNPFSKGLVNEGLYNRISFDVNHLTKEEGVGTLVGANWFQVQNVKS